MSAADMRQLMVEDLPVDGIPDIGAFLPEEVVQEREGRPPVLYFDQYAALQSLHTVALFEPVDAHDADDQDRQQHGTDDGAGQQDNGPTPGRPLRPPDAHLVVCDHVVTGRPNARSANPGGSAAAQGWPAGKKAATPG